MYLLSSGSGSAATRTLRYYYDRRRVLVRKKMKQWLESVVMTNFYYDDIPNIQHKKSWFFLLCLTYLGKVNRPTIFFYLAVAVVGRRSRSAKT